MLHHQLLIFRRLLHRRHTLHLQIWLLRHLCLWYQPLKISLLLMLLHQVWRIHQWQAPFCLPLHQYHSIPRGQCTLQKIPQFCRRMLLQNFHRLRRWSRRKQVGLTYSTWLTLIRYFTRSIPFIYLSRCFTGAPTTRQWQFTATCISIHAFASASASPTGSLQCKNHVTPTEHNTKSTIISPRRQDHSEWPAAAAAACNRKPTTPVIHSTAAPVPVSPCQLFGVSKFLARLGSVVWERQTERFIFSIFEHILNLTFISRRPDE